MALSYRAPDGTHVEGGVLLLVGPVLAWLALWTGLLPWHVDDAGITYAYAQTVAAGHGLRASPTSAIAEGFSNPAWMLLLAGVTRAGVPVLVASKALQALLGALTVVGVNKLVRATGGRRDEAAGAALATAVTGPWVIWSAGGLETAWLSACLVGLLWASAARAPGWVAGVCGAGIVLARPEGPVLAAGALAAASLLRSDPGGRLRRAVAWGFVVAAICAWAGVRWAHFDGAWPTAWWVKVVPQYAIVRAAKGAVYAATFAAEVALPLLALGWGAAMGIRRLRGLARAVALYGALHVGVVVVMGGDWMRHGRLLAPLVPLLTAGAIPGLLALLYRPRDVGRRVLVGSTRHLGWAFLVVYTAIGLLFWTAAMRRPPLPIEVTARSADLLTEVGPAWCAELVPHVASPDVGALLLRHPDARIEDLGGLTDPEAARSGGPSWWPERLAERRPQVVLLHGPWVPRTGLYPEVMHRIGYVPVCSRRATPGPLEDRYPPTLYRRAGCTRPLPPTLVARLDFWCATPR